VNPTDGGEPQSAASASPGRGSALKRLLRPFRRAVAWFALVGEERSSRAQALQRIEREHGHVLGELQASIEELRGVAWTLNDRLDKGVGERADVTLKEIWRRMESADARQTTALQRLAEEVERVLEDNAAIFTLFAERGVGPAASGQMPERGRKLAHEILAEATGEPPPGTIGTPAAFPDVPTTDELFRELERGSREEVLEKLRHYMGLFAGKGPVLDLGSGRGEFLELAAQSGIDAYGVDSDAEAVAFCKGLGLDARHDDLFDHLRGLAPGSLGGIVCMHVVEHLPPETIAGFFRDIARALQPGGIAAVETPNPASFSTHVNAFWRDPTHIRPVPSVTLASAARQAGLVVEDVVYLSPAPDEARLKQIEVSTDDPVLRGAVDDVNRALGQLNGLLYGPQDYSLVARKPV
jgi:SAM-dependent methyltransferase